MKCPWPETCACTHDIPCDRGWISLQPLVHTKADGTTYETEQVRKCPTCSKGRDSLAERAQRAEEYARAGWQ